MSNAADSSPQMTICRRGHHHSNPKVARLCDARTLQNQRDVANAVGPKYKCKRCGSEFSDSGVYQEHLRESHSSDS